MAKPEILIVMGVSGSGKSTVGRLLAQELGWQYLEGDDFHPPANVEKMRSGTPLTDEDRLPWLDALRDLVRDALKRNRHLVVTCSALKQKYRQRLAVDESKVVYIYLKGDFELIANRLKGRKGHFMPETLLKSQFEAMEEPKDAITVDVALSPRDIVDRIKNSIELK